MFIHSLLENSRNSTQRHTEKERSGGLKRKEQKDKVGQDPKSCFSKQAWRHLAATHQARDDTMHQPGPHGFLFSAHRIEMKECRTTCEAPPQKNTCFPTVLRFYPLGELSSVQASRTLSKDNDKGSGHAVVTCMFSCFSWTSGDQY